jgi:hypothetical protein
MISIHDVFAVAEQWTVGTFCPREHGESNGLRRVRKLLPSLS